jgi:hypothetical protein
MKRPKLRKTDLKEVMAAMLGGEKPGCLISMSRGQWDNLLDNAYHRGWTLLELDEFENPISAYRKKGTA